MSASYKAIFLGAPDVGKTCLFTYLRKKVFDENTQTTMGYQVIFNVHNDIKIELWDTAGCELYDSMTEQYTRNVDIYIIVFDLADLKTLDKARYWLNHVKKIEGIKHTILVGNKVDLMDIKTDYEFVQNLERQRVDYIATSPKKPVNMDLFKEYIYNAAIKIDKRYKESGKPKYVQPSIKLSLNEDNNDKFCRYC
jgi:small GTP-binding protein